jgi:hypothetical protein
MHDECYSVSLPLLLSKDLEVIHTSSRTGLPDQEKFTIFETCSDVTVKLIVAHKTMHSVKKCGASIIALEKTISRFG